MARTPRRERPSKCCAALSAIDGVGAGVKPGKQGLKGEHRGLIDEDVSVGCSLDLDVATKLLRGEGEKCWDYVICAAQDTHAVEVHPCGGGSVDDMRGKRAWALRFLREHEVEVRRWFWLVPKNAAFSFRRGGHEERQLRLAGIAMPRRVLQKRDLDEPG